MTKVLLIQLPVPQLSFGRVTANIAFAAACLKQALAAVRDDFEVEILSELSSTYLGDGALLDRILALRPAIIGFSVYAWNVTRALHFAQRIKRHYSPLILFGGPEVTPDNRLSNHAYIDTHCFGAGESCFVATLNRYQPGDDSVSMSWDAFFEKAPSPYLSGEMAPPPAYNPMLLESMRGCPHRCSYCYYHKSLGKPVFKRSQAVLDGIAWAVSRGVREIYMLDPSLDARPDLNPLLKEIAVLNKDRKLGLVGELRAEQVDAELAELLAAAGFHSFEIGLQTINPLALSLVHRQTDISRWLSGINWLHRAGIKTSIDLIVGLPGDDPAHFRQTIEFIFEHDLQDNIQVFPLLILPGTRLRQSADQLGLLYDPEPPYSIISSPGFSTETLSAALVNAETRLDISLYPQPDLELSYNSDNDGIERAMDVWVGIDAQRFIRKVILHPERKMAELAGFARRVTHPYQLMVPPRMKDFQQVFRCVTLFTECNPFIPLELVFFEPDSLPCFNDLLSAARIHRPHYLDGDQRWAYSQPGNRAMLITCVTRYDAGGREGAMQRRVFWWTENRLPELADLGRLEKSAYQGILIDSPFFIPSDIIGWQERMALEYQDTIAISFARLADQKRWFELTAADVYIPDITMAIRPPRS